MILRRVNLPGVSYCAEPISLGYHTAQSQSPQVSCESFVKICVEISPGPGYDTPGSQFFRN